jgi:hypothetical protein
MRSLDLNMMKGFAIRGPVLLVTVLAVALSVSASTLHHDVFEGNEAEEALRLFDAEAPFALVAAARPTVFRR